MTTRPALVVAVSVLLTVGGIPGLTAGLMVGPMTTGAETTEMTAGAGDRELARSAATPENFSYGSMTVNGEPAEGERPVLVILVEYADVSFDAANAPEDVEALFAENRRYFTENSRGAFTWDPVVVGPFTHPDNDSTEDIDESLFNCAKGREPVNGSGGCPGADAGWYDNHSAEAQLTAAVELAASEGDVDFTAYDEDDDGRVTPDELTVALVTAEPDEATDDIPTVRPGGGAARAAAPDTCVDAGDVSVCTSSRGSNGRWQAGAVMLDEWTKFTTVAHELSHTLGTFDLYGANSRLNSDLTLMDATIGEDERYHLDPWHKIQLGWVKPRIYAMGDRNDDPECATFAPLADSGRLADRDTRRPIILYSPQRYDLATHRGEFYILEYRNRASFDADVSDEGVALWYVVANNGEPRALNSAIVPGGDRKALATKPSGDDVKTEVRGEEQIHAGPNGLLETRVATDDDGDALDKVATDRMVLHVSPGTIERGTPTNYSHRGESRLWEAADGDIRPRWFGGDGAGPPFSVAGTDSDGNLVVDLNTRVIEITSPSEATWAFGSSDPVTLWGYFGHNGTASGDARVIRIVGGIDKTLSRSIQDWSCDRLRVAPFYIPVGVYQLFVEDPETGTSSNRIDLTVRREVAADGWRGTYTGSIDGRDVTLTIRGHPGDDFNDDITLVDEVRGVTYTGTMAQTSENVVEDLELTSAGGDVVEIDSLVLDLEEHDHLAGLTTAADGSSRGVAFSDTDGWTPSAGPTLVADDPETWTDQWTGDYRGYLDGRPATLTVSGGERVEFGTLRPGEGYRFEVELVDEGFGITYRGSGVIDATEGRTHAHVLEVSELTAIEGRADGYDEYEQLYDVQFRLHTADTARISGQAKVGEHSPGYGPKASRYGFHFVEGAVRTLTPELASTIRSIETADIPWYVRPVVQDERVNVHLPDGSFGIETGDDGTPTAVRETSFKDPTLDIYVSEEAVAEIERSDDPQQAVISAIRSGGIEYKASSLGGRFKYGVVRVAVDVYDVVSNLGKRLPKFPFLAVR